MGRTSRLEAVATGRGFDGWIVITTMALVSLGALMVYSASVNEALQANSSFGILAKQGVYTALGLAALGFGALVPYKTWGRLAIPIAAASLILLVLVLVPHVGTSTNGAQRWFQFRGAQFQPSELAKIAVAVYFARWLSEKGSKVRSFNACTAPFGIMLAMVCLLIVIQPDLGTAAVIGLAMIVMFFAAGARLEHLGIGIGTGFALAMLAVRFEAYRNARIKVWLHPWRYASSVGFHTAHVLEALGAGGLFGVGLGNSRQKYVLPAPSTDSIFAITGEELGFVGASAILLLFGILAWRGIKAAREAPDGFGRLLAVGITASITIQAFLNIAVITNSVPFTGIPLPFISAGGSSLVVSLFGVGVLLNISRQSRTSRASSDDNGTRGSRRDEDSGDGRKDRRARLPRAGRRRVLAPVPVSTHIVRIWGDRKRAPRYG